MSNYRYAPAPFWFLNHKLEDEELRRQLRLMKESGVSGFFIHPRAGLLTPYGSDEWFRAVRVIVEEAAKLDLQAWLYDEDPFPSGAAGGRIVMENPGYIALNMKHKILQPDETGRVFADLGEAGIVTAFSYIPDEKAGARDLIDMSGKAGVLRENYFKSPWFNAYYCDWREDRPYPHERAETYFPHMVFDGVTNPDRKVMVVYTDKTTYGKYGCIPDCLNPDVIKRFIELTHEKYKETVGEYFGTVIPGIFTDEPFLGGSMPWTAKLFETFKELHGYELCGELFRLWLGTDEDAHRLRRDYWATIRHLYRTSFFGQLSDWCRANNLEFVGHVNSEEDPFCHSSDGGAYSNMKYLDTPGLDHLAQNLGNRERPALLFGAHSICSAARQLGRERVLCECMACNPYSFGPRDMRRIANWLFSQGVNWMVPHGFYYSYDGVRKHDAGKSFFFQDEFFGEFPKYAAYTERMGSRIAAGKPLGVTAVLQLADRVAGFMPSEPAKAKEVRHHLFRAVAGLAERHIEYENISTEIMEGGTVENGVVTLGHRQYTQVLVPCAASESSPLIEQMKTAGVQVYFGENGEFDWDAILAGGAVQTPLTGEGAADVLVNRQGYADGEEVFLFNNIESVATLELDGEWALWDADEEKYYRVEWPLSLSGYGAALIKAMPTAGLPVWEGVAEPFAPLAQKFIYRPVGALATVTEWNVDIRTATGATYNLTRDFCLLRDVAGTDKAYLMTRERPIFDVAPDIPFPYPAQATYTATFTLPETAGERRLLTEGSTFCGNWTLTINGHRLTAADFEPCNVYDFTNRAAVVTPWLKAGENVLTVSFDAAGEFDGVASAVYIM